jgi:hypothetical protein
MQDVLREQIEQEEVGQMESPCCALFKKNQRRFTSLGEACGRIV